MLSVPLGLTYVPGRQSPGTEEELKAAQRFESMELAYWRTLLAFLPAHPLIADALRPHVESVSLDLDRRLAELRSPQLGASLWEGELQRLAQELRVADIDRAGLNATYERMRSWLPEAGGSVATSGPSYGFQSAHDYIAALHLAWRAQQSVRNALVSANLRLVVTIARRYRFEQLALEDLVQEGNLGLIKAVERFDHRLGFRFSTYASWWVRHAIKRAIADKARTVRIPVHMVEARSILNRTKQQLVAQRGEEPSDARLSNATGISAAKVELASRVLETRLSLDAPMNGTEGTCFKDQIEDPNVRDPLDQMSIAGWLERLPDWLDVLTPIEYQILRWRFGLEDMPEMTLQEIGERYGYSRERVRQLEERALAKIRHLIEERHGVAPDLDEC